MNIFIDWFAASFLTLVGLACLLSLNKKLRGQRGALNHQLNLADASIIAVTAGVITFPGWPLWLNIVLAASVAIYGLLLWLDALLFVQYRIEINRHSLRWFFTGSKGLMKGAPELFSALKKFTPATLLPVLLAMLLWAEMQSTVVLFTTVLGLVIFSLVAVYVKTQGLISGLLITLAGLAASLAVFNLTDSTSILSAWQPAMLFVLTVVSFASLYVYKFLFAPNVAFFSTPSLLPNIIKNDIFVARTGIHHQPLVDKVMARFEGKAQSAEHGRCAGANVILITVESLGPYVAPYANPLAESKLAKRFTQHSWHSKQHFSLCPNTTVSTNQIYTGQYSNNPYNKDESAFYGAEPKHIKRLQQEGYKTFFVDSADIQLYDYHKLLKRIGFDQVYGTADMPSDGLSADYRLWNMVDTLAEQAGESPFFMHIINDQTHMPYEVVDKRRFNRHKGNSNKAKYLNAFEEVDYILDEFLNRLAQKIDLSNTLVIFTGDHGESFGEYGYSFHSNSIVAEQTQVPFFMTHPALDNRELEHSCHFDLFPTVFDLLGVTPEYDYFGQTMGIEHKPKAYFFHSATLKGNTPANFCTLVEDDMFWNDRLFSQAYQLTSVGGKWQKGSNQNDVDVAALNAQLLNSFSLMS